MEKIANSWVIAVAINYFVFEMLFVMFEFVFNINKLRIELVFFGIFG